MGISDDLTVNNGLGKEDPRKWPYFFPNFLIYQGNEMEPAR